MGSFIYDRTTKVNIEDRTLAHLQMVIGAKLRRGESFHFSWRNDVSIGDGRTSVWMHQAVPLVYVFSGSRAPTLNPAWIDALAVTANSPAGLHVVPEPTDAHPATPTDLGI